MNKQIYKKLLKSIIILAVSMVILNTSGCSLINRIFSPQQENPGSEQAEKIPKELEEMESGIESIFRTLGAPATGEDEKEGQDGQGQSNQGQSKQAQSSSGQEDSKQSNDSQGEKTQGQEKQGQENQGGQQGQQQKQEGANPWKKVSLEIDGLHSKWNNYLPQAVEKRVDSKVIDGFSNSLNDLTNIIEGKNKTNTLLSANLVYSSIPDFYSLYKVQYAGEIKRMVYYARSCVLYSSTGAWTEVDIFMKDLKATWTLLKAALDKEQLKSTNKLDLAIYELEKVVEEKDPQLVNIKGRLTLTNIQELEKEIKESKK